MIAVSLPAAWRGSAAVQQINPTSPLAPTTYLDKGRPPMSNVGWRHMPSNKTRLRHRVLDTHALSELADEVWYGTNGYWYLKEAGEFRLQGQWDWAIGSSEHPNVTTKSGVVGFMPGRHTSSEAAIWAHTQRLLSTIARWHVHSMKRLSLTHYPPPSEIKQLCRTANEQNRVLFDLPDITNESRSLAKTAMSGRVNAFIASTRILKHDRPVRLSFYTTKPHNFVAALLDRSKNDGVSNMILPGDLSEIFNVKSGLMYRLSAGTMVSLISRLITVAMMRHTRGTTDTSSMVMLKGKSGERLHFQVTCDEEADRCDARLLSMKWQPDDRYPPILANVVQQMDEMEF